ncbi:cytochrome P450 [Luteipulveratus mongoliensis]|uniref:cytochrome P450 n=1 Tax=Luteipulveratus mongoliensis TaxID=571913 RepID=UPI0006987431|nr:cytochrome P450 [Luteipulveratus mongoliensis]
MNEQRQSVRWDDRGRVWLITGHAAAVETLRSKSFSAEGGQRERGAAIKLPPTMLNTDGAAHQRLRTPAASLLGVRATAQLLVRSTPRIREIIADVDSDLDALEGIGLPCATAVFAEMLGLRADQVAEFEEVAAAAGEVLNPSVRGAAAARSAAAMPRLAKIVAERLASAGPDDHLHALATDNRIDRREQVGVVILAIVGGWQPLADFIVNGLPLLLEEYARVGTSVLDDPEGLESELMRLHAPIPLVSRVALQDTVIDGQAVEEGQRVVVMLSEANRDPAVFPEPDAIDVRRDPSLHLGFGAGSHYCMGAILVRDASALVHEVLLELHPKVRPVSDQWSWEPSLIPRRLQPYRLYLR